LLVLVLLHDGVRSLQLGLRVADKKSEFLLSAQKRNILKRYASSTADEVLDEGSNRIKGRLGTLYKFTRPHTIRGTLLASFAGVAKALSDCGVSFAEIFTGDLFISAICGVIALLCSNAFIVGINQIFDVQVDKINKPFLPIAAGELSTTTAWLLLGMCATTGLTLCYHFFSPLIFGLYLLGTSIGTIYSVPPFELKKRGPLYAGLSIAICRGFLLNFGVYYAVLEAIGVPFQWNPGVVFMARFMTVFAAVIAVTKDLPDVDGDKKYGFETFATKLGAPRVAGYACLALALNYVSAILEGAFSPYGSFNKFQMIFGHAFLANQLAQSWNQFSRRVSFSENEISSQQNTSNAVKTLYKQIWDLAYLEYFLYIFI